MFAPNDLLQGMACPRCGSAFELGDYHAGCPVCARQRYPVNLTLTYRGRRRFRSEAKRMFRYRDYLPYAGFPTLGEGQTPIVALPNLAERFQLAALYVKNEFQNPTGSHKDRMSPLVVARAMALGKKCVVAASSGNAGASLAAYAAAGGIACKIVSAWKINPIWKKAIEIHGAELIRVENFLDRWPTLQRLVDEEDAYPATNFVTPPVGSNPFGIQGYKTIAYEIHEEFGRELPTFVLIPSCRGDLLWGVYEGFKDLLDEGLTASIPRLVAVEPYPRISRVLAGEDYRITFAGDSSRTLSIEGETLTYQAVTPIVATRGLALDIRQDDVDDHRGEMAGAGLYLESSSATIFGALAQLSAMKLIDRNTTVLALATSHGYKDVP